MITIHFLIAALFLGGPSVAFAQAGESAPAQRSAAQWVLMADAQYDAGQFGVSADSYGQAILAGARNPTTFFNAACSSALAGRVDEAFERLNGAVERGLWDADQLIADTDLSVLHEDPRWSGLVTACREAEETFLASLGNPQLRAELLEMSRIDQAARRGIALPELEGLSMMDVDATHTARMKEIVAEYGWPGESLVGEDGARSAWLLVQHADMQPAFQRECLDLMTAAPEGDVSPLDLAYLTDRVLVNEGQKQIYGTQFHMVDGQSVPRPIEDEANIEARRAAVGLSSMKEYTARMQNRN